MHNKDISEKDKKLIILWNFIVAFFIFTVSFFIRNETYRTISFLIANSFIITSVLGIVIFILIKIIKILTII